MFGAGFGSAYDTDVSGASADSDSSARADGTEASAPRLRVFCRPDMALSCRSCSGVRSGSELFIIQIVVHDLSVGETGFAHLFGLSCFEQIQCFRGVGPGNIAFRLPEQQPYIDGWFRWLLFACMFQINSA